MGDYNARNYRPPRFIDGKAGVFLFYVPYFGIVILPVLFSFVVFGDAPDSPLMLFAKGSALTAFAVFSLQVALGSRLKTLDRLCGIDRILRFHKKMAIFGTVLAVAHPILIMIEYGDFSLIGFDSMWEIIIAEVALIILLGGVAIALLRSKIKLDYNVWHIFHKGMFFVILLVFIHSMAIGSDTYAGTKTLWWILLSISTLVFLYRNIVFPLFIRKRFDIVAVEKETHDTYTIRMKPTKSGIKPYHPGQFAFFKLMRTAGKSEEHPFTIASPPSMKGEIFVTIKESGNFTDTISETTKRDHAKIAMPFGKFSFVHDEPKKLLFIAGGVGITPIMSMIRFLRDSGDGREVRLIFGNRTEQDILFRAELNSLPENFKVLHVLSQPNATWDGNKGYISAETIVEFAGELLDDCGVFVCGPSAMMSFVGKQIRKAGFKGKIRKEEFALD